MSDVTFAEIKQILKTLSASQAKTDAQLAKTDAQLAKTDAQLAKTDAQLAKTDAQLAATDARLEQKLNRLSELYGGVSDNQGSVAEEFFVNSLTAHPVIGDIRYDRVQSQISVRLAKGKQAEFDLVLVNGEAVALIEVKHKAHVSALDQLQKQLALYREAFPEHASYHLYGGIAGLSVPKATVEAAHKRGMFVLKQEGKAFTVDAQAMQPF